MWIWRKMENIKWTDKITNEEVLLRVGETRKLRETIRMRKKRWMGHVLRHEGLMKDVLEGRMEGKRPRGRKIIMMMDDIKDGRSYFRTKRDAEDKELWREAPWGTCLRQNTRWWWWSSNRCTWEVRSVLKNLRFRLNQLLINIRFWGLFQLPACIHNSMEHGKPNTPILSNPTVHLIRVKTNTNLIIWSNYFQVPVRQSKRFIQFTATHSRWTGMSTLRRMILSATTHTLVWTRTYINI